jgi:uncharacterized membrane protein
MTAIAAQPSEARLRSRARRPWLQPVFLALALLLLIAAAAALTLTLAQGRPLPWQFHRPWVSPHVAGTLLLLALGAAQLALPKGDARHRLVGYGWCAAMAFICVSGLMIQLEPGHITIPHMASSVFAVANLMLLPVVIWSARTGRRRTHRIAVLWMFGLMLNAGAMAFIPQRAIGSLVFGLFH